MHPEDHPQPRPASVSDPAAFPALLVPLDPAFRAIGVRRTKGYELVATGHLTLVKIGSKSLITAESLRRFAAGLPPARATAER